jgi:acylphosphatase
MATVCKRVTYSGRVQGVGFRFAARQIAAGFQVVGFVRNLSGGNVELVAEGEADDVERYFAAVAQRLCAYITGADVNYAKPVGFTSFDVRQ